jgi:hypothetical protein|tara:strand:- start:3699 stop:3866 length:168 start_codon:yes stop_codon:yes gene_type:complete
MEFTKIYVGVLYLVVVITSLIFYLNNYYIIASLLILGNVLPGYKLAVSLSGNHEN